MIIGNAASERRENVVVNEGTNDRDFTVSNSSNNTTVDESAINVKTLERCFNEKIDREMCNIVDTVEDRIQNAILAAIDNIVAPKIELAIRSINASSGRDVTSVTANSERGERVGISASFENASENDILRVSNVNDETRQNILDEVGELSVPETRFDRKPPTPHTGKQLGIAPSTIPAPKWGNFLITLVNSIAQIQKITLTLTFVKQNKMGTGMRGNTKKRTDKLRVVQAANVYCKPWMTTIQKTGNKY